MFCHKCGTQLEIEAQFCHKCGTKAFYEETEPSTTDSTEETTAKTSDLIIENNSTLEGEPPTERKTTKVIEWWKNCSKTKRIII